MKTLLAIHEEHSTAEKAACEAKLRMNEAALSTLAFDASMYCYLLIGCSVEVSVWRDRSKALRSDLSSMEAQRNEVQLIKWLLNFNTIHYCSSSCNLMT